MKKFSSGFSFMDFIQENNKRKQHQAVNYDPLTGENCCGNRFLLQCPDAPLPRLWLPVEMKNIPAVKMLAKHRSTRKLIVSLGHENTKTAYENFWTAFFESRIQYDFEFFAVSFIKIRDKITAQNIPFQLNRGQRKLLDELENIRKTNTPIRIILLKARQWGGSTLIQLYMFWIQLVHKKNWNSVICAHLKDASITIRSMFERAITHMSPINGISFGLKNYQGTQNIKEVPERGCLITVGTALEPDSVRSQDAKMAHFSEIGFYPNTEKNRTEDLITSIVGSIPREPLTVVAFESTANGVGDFFYNEWEKAKKGETAYQPVFVEWFLIDIYKTPFNGQYYDHAGKLRTGNTPEFVRSMNDYEKELFQHSPDITLENLNWYRAKQAEMPSPSKMKQEYPSNDIEAFQDSGCPVFKSAHVEAMRKHCTEPVMIGTLKADGLPSQAKLDKSKGKETLKNITFIPDHETFQLLKTSDPRQKAQKENNKLRVWEYPDKEVKVSNRYVVVYDPAKGVSDKADWGVIAVFDRYWMMYGGVPELVAEWRGHEDKDITIWTACQIATFYNNALLVVESNTFDSGERYDDSEFIFDTISSCYTNLYYRTPADKIMEGVPVKYGFHTNRSTKPLIVDNYVAILREQGYKERNHEALNEARCYEQNSKGVFAAKEGKHDDILMTRMIGLHICYELQLPKLVAENEGHIRTRKSVSEASF